MLLFLHLIGVTFWLGGQLLLVTTVVPVLRGIDEPQRRELIGRVGRRYGSLSIPVLLVILITGALMAANYDLSPADSAALRAKLVAVAVLIAATVIHIITAARTMRRASRAAAMVALLATLAAVWFATGI